ncbi:hypothetical protein ACPPVQ_05845 [Diaminobutyricibacter sp. McL0618]|uniref:hypothetical protein n=1 Tax=Leifsonia sp. McL0618 TaxID=3415677 RepID=UPI003CF3DA37
MGLVVLACLAGVGAWLTGLIGLIMITSGNATGWVLLVTGVLLLALTIVAIVAAVCLRVAPESQPGAANPHFDEPQPSQDPRGG